MNKYVVVLLLAVLLLSGCISGSGSCVTDCMYSNVDVYTSEKDACIDGSDKVYNDTMGVEAYCIFKADRALRRDCETSCSDVW